MAKKLILIRHSKSDWSVSGQKDVDRTLAKQGIESANRIGIYLKEQNIFSEHFYVSAAERTKETALIVASILNIDINKITFSLELYNATPKDLLDFIVKIPDTKDEVMLFGHNPGISIFAEFLTGKMIGSMPTSGMVLIEFDLDLWSEISKSSGNLKSKIFLEEE